MKKIIVLDTFFIAFFVFPIFSHSSFHSENNTKRAASTFSNQKKPRLTEVEHHKQSPHKSNQQTSKSYISIPNLKNQIDTYDPNNDIVALSFCDDFLKEYKFFKKLSKFIKQHKFDIQTLLNFNNRALYKMAYLVILEKQQIYKTPLFKHTIPAYQAIQNFLTIKNKHRHHLYKNYSINISSISQICKNVKYPILISSANRDWFLNYSQVEQRIHQNRLISARLEFFNYVAFPDAFFTNNSARLVFYILSYNNLISHVRQINNLALDPDDDGYLKDVLKDKKIFTLKNQFIFNKINLFTKYKTDRKILAHLKKSMHYVEKTFDLYTKLYSRASIKNKQKVISLKRNIVNFIKNTRKFQIKISRFLKQK